MEIIHNQKIFKALAEAKKHFKAVVKDESNPFFKSKYATLEALLEAVEPALTQAGLLVTQGTKIIDGVTCLDTRIYHIDSGEYIESVYALRPAKDDPQGMGSAYSYARRYCLKGLLSLAEVDDDGQLASAPPKVKSENTDLIRKEIGALFNEVKDKLTPAQVIKIDSIKPDTGLATLTTIRDGLKKLL